VLAYSPKKAKLFSFDNTSESGDYNIVLELCLDFELVTCLERGVGILQIYLLKRGKILAGIGLLWLENCLKGFIKT